MPTLANTTDIAVSHLLIIGKTKAGKSDFVARAVNAGFTCLYIDSDNGLGTLKEVIKPEFQKNLHYINPAEPVLFAQDFFERSVIRYNETRRKMYDSMSYSDDDKFAEIIPSRIPRNVIVSFDSWTSMCFDSVSSKANKLEIDLSDADKYGQELYQATGLQMTKLATGIQGAPFHVIVQAHPAQYERKEKPAGSAMKSIKQGDYILKETIDIPSSTSNPHGYNMGKFFNNIGWLTVNRVGERDLDFRVRDDRVSGGSVKGHGNPLSEYSFANLFGQGQIESEIDPEKPWIKYMTVGEFREQAAAKHASAPKLVGGKLR